MKEAKLLWGATDIGPPHFSGDILWRSRFKAPDPFWLVEADTEAYILMSPLEVGRAEKESTGVCVVHFWEYLERATPKSEIEGVKLFLKDRGVRGITIPFDFPHGFAAALMDAFEVTIEKGIFFPERAKKSLWEIKEIEKAQRAVEQAVHEAIEFLRSAAIRDNKIFQGTDIVTSETVRNIIDRNLFMQGYLGVDTIVACEIQAADPHCKGSGPLMPRQPIVIDVFPLSLDTHYYADQTRTVFKGEPSDDLKKMYQAVLEAQNTAIQMARAGIHGRELHNAAVKTFGDRYPTNTKERPMEGCTPTPKQGRHHKIAEAVATEKSAVNSKREPLVWGFIHGLGHGVGIDVHEFPRLGKTDDMLEVGNVVTVEPGLYYAKSQEHIPAGGIRIEDMVLIEEAGCRNLTLFPKVLEEMIL